ncbi:MAG: hypothetical protein V1737_04075 [Chloroflexota bacterium]
MAWAATASNHSGLQDIADQVAQFLKLPKTPTVVVKPTARGWAHLRTGSVTIPGYILGQPEAYQRYYVAHEVVHFYTGPGHDMPFKRAEAEVLAGLFDIAIVTSRSGCPPRHRLSGRLVYPVALLDKRTQDALWSRSTLGRTGGSSRMAGPSMAGRARGRTNRMRR